MPDPNVIVDGDFEKKKDWQWQRMKLMRYLGSEEIVSIPADISSIEYSAFSGAKRPIKKLIFSPKPGYVFAGERMFPSYVFGKAGSLCDLQEIEVRYSNVARRGESYRCGCAYMWHAKAPENVTVRLILPDTIDEKTDKPRKRTLTISGDLSLDPCSSGPKIMGKNTEVLFLRSAGTKMGYFHSEEGRQACADRIFFPNVYLGKCDCVTAAVLLICWLKAAKRGQESVFGPSYVSYIRTRIGSIAENVEEDSVATVMAPGTFKDVCRTFMNKGFEFTYASCQDLIEYADRLHDMEFKSEIMDHMSKHIDIEKVEQKKTKAQMQELFDPCCEKAVAKIWRKRVEGSKCTIINWADNDLRKETTEVEIPPRVGSVKVTSLAPKLFAHCHELVSIILPDSIEEIGIDCFTACGVRELDLPGGIKRIPENAFGSAKIQRIKLPDSLVQIDKDAFHYSELRQAEFPPSLMKIGESAFTACGLEKVELSGPMFIEKEAFSYCKKLKTVNVGQGVGSIPPRCFYGCETMTEVKVDSDGLVGIGAEAFRACYQLQKVSLPSTVDFIGFGAFESTRLKEIETRAAVIEAEAFAWSKLQSAKVCPRILKKDLFYRCGELKTVEAPFAMHVEDSVFGDCVALEEVKLGKVISISAKAFERCVALKKIMVCAGSNLDMLRAAAPNTEIVEYV